MKHIFLRSLTLFLAFVILFSLCSPVVFAADDDFASSPMNLYNGLFHSVARLFQDGGNLEGTPLAFLFDFVASREVSSSYCESSPDNLHHASRLKSEVKRQLLTGYEYADAICNYCGLVFPVYNADFADAYNKYRDELPASGYNSDGTLTLTLDYGGSYVLNYESSYFAYYCDHFAGPYDPNYRYVKFPSEFPGDGSFNCSAPPSVTLYPKSGKEGFPFYSVRFEYFLIAPQDGYYSPVGKFLLNGLLRYNGSAYQLNKEQLRESFPPSGIFYKAGSTINLAAIVYPDYFLGKPMPTNTQYSYLSVAVAPPKVLYTPLPGEADNITNIYNPSLRFNNITGNFAYYDNSGDVQYVNNITIVNENNKTFYNPVTGKTEIIDNWTYDYANNSCTVTLPDGKTATVTYGDENITIDNGDVSYNVYYVLPETKLPETHTHNWGKIGERKATCTTYGTQSFMCLDCKEEQTQTVPALGHNYVQVGRVDAVTDESGNQTEPAYMLYRCSRCNQEYKDYDGAGPPAPPPPAPTEPPGSGGGGGNSGILDLLNLILSLLRLATGDGVEVAPDFEINLPEGSGGNGAPAKVGVVSIIATLSWWKKIAVIGERFLTQITSGGPPSIPIKLSAAKSQYGASYGGDMEMLDLSWYEPYKPTVDSLVSGFLWLAFLWALFRHAPAVISGSGLILSKGPDIQAGHKGSRKGGSK